MKKRLMTLALSTALVAATALTGCGNTGTSGDSSSQKSSGTTETSSSTASADGSLKIGVVTNNSGADSYQSVWYDHMSEYAAENGVNLTILDPQGDSTKHANMVQDLIQMNLDCIIIWPIDSDASVAEFKAVKEAGIPVVDANTLVSEAGMDYVDCFVGPSNVKESEQAAEAMKEMIPEDANVVAIEYMTGYQSNTERMSGLTNVIEGTNIKVLDTQQGEANREKSQQIMENYLVRYGAGEIDAVFCYDDTTALGAYNAIEAAGRLDEIKICAAACGAYSTVQYVKDGKINAISMQSPIIETETILDTAIALANGNAPADFYTYIDTPLITTETVDSVEIEEF